MASTIRLSRIGVHSSTLSTLVANTTNWSILKLWRCTQTPSSRPFVSSISINRINCQLKRNNIIPTSAQTKKLELVFKPAVNQINKRPQSRQFSFFVPIFAGAVKNAGSSKTKNDKIEIDFLNREYSFTNAKIKKANFFPTAKNYSSDEKTPSAKKSLAEEIMQSKMVDTSQDNKKLPDNPEKDTNPEQEPINPWTKRGYYAFGIFVGGALIVNAVIFSLPDRDEDGNDLKDEFTDLPFPSQYYLRLKNKIFKTKKDLEEPFSDKLLPDPLAEPYHQPKYTVLLELTGLLVHSNWTHKHGWRFQKRPGVDIFISQIGYPEFELVMYTTENAMTFYPIVDGLDPEAKFIMYRLFRDATRYVDGHHTKDLFALNRDLKKVIVVDWNENTVAANRDNALILKKWEGDNTDRQLIGLTQLLQAIKQSDVDDVRDVLRYYKNHDDPIEAFRENQRKLQETLAAEEQSQKEKQSQGGLFSSSLSSFRRFGR